jgi:hypothetical protein
MKSVMVSLASVLLCACAADPRPAPIALNPSDYQAPTEQELLFQQKVAMEPQLTAADTARLERQRYQDSLAKIEEELGTQRLLIQGCVDNYHGVANKQCYALLQKFCVIDELVDSRGDIHRKEYCGKEFLNYHNPNIKH